MIHRLAAALALVAIGISVPVAPVPVQAASWADGPCTDNVGITIVIDFQDLGGGVNVRCAPGPVTSGLDALNKAGVSWEGTQRFPGFVCRIAGLPDPDSESCGTTPPTSRYWTYWVAPRGGSWCYASVGAGSRTPPPGTIEGWSFALNRVSVDIPPPRFDPPPPIPGEAPNPLRGGDCSSPATPTPTPPGPAPTTPQPVATPAPASPAPPQASVVPAEPDSAGTTVSPPPEQASQSPAVANATPQPVANAGAPTSTTSVAVATTTSIGGSSTTQPATTSTGEIDRSVSGSGNTSAPDTGSVPLGTVDLGDDGRGDGGFSPAAGLGLLIAAAVGGTSVWAARRRRGAPP